MHELERRARALGWTWEQLARELGMDRTTLAHIRSGRDRVSLATLHKVALWFPNDETLKRLAWEYLLLDVQSVRERRAREQSCSGTSEAYAAQLSTTAREQLQRFVGEFGSHVIRGTGLFLESADALALTASLAFLEAEFSARSIHIVRERGSAKVPASAKRSLIAIPLLLIDRVEFASPSMAQLLAERQQFGKVTVATRLENTPRSETEQLLERRMHHARIDPANPTVLTNA